MRRENKDRKTGADTELNVLYEKIMQKHNEWLYHESYLGASENVTSLKYSPFADAISFCSDKENNYAGKVQKYRHDKRNNVTHYVDEGQQRRGFHPHNQNKRPRTNEFSNGGGGGGGGSRRHNNNSWNGRNTGICNNFKRYGNCNFGNNCRYQHISNNCDNNNNNGYGNSRYNNNNNNNYSNNNNHDNNNGGMNNKTKKEESDYMMM